MQRRAFIGFATASLASLACAKETKNEAVYLSPQEWLPFETARNRLKSVKRYVGYANFNLISFDDVLKTAHRVSKIGAFTKAELALIEKLFYDETAQYGFFGKRTCDSLTLKINKKETLKIPRTGHYLFKGEPLDAYKRLKKDVGPSLVLTSGIRSIPKQMDLFFSKIKRCQGNISLASKSIAPPACSYHAIGDFDVGKKGWGYLNFTAKFARTEEFWKLQKLKYISTRYTINNKDGVRFEPWHIQIV